MSIALSNIASTIRNRLNPAVVCVFAFLINVVAYYPGFLTSDSLDQYEQAITGKYGNWHPPAFTLLWRLLNGIYEGPFLLLVFQLGLLWGSGYVLMQTVKHCHWRIAIFVFCLAPFVQNFAGCVVKDSQMALPWLFSFALLFRAHVMGKRLPLPTAFFALLLLLYGTLVRFNALPGAVPLYFYWAWVVFRPIKRTLAILVFAALCLLGAFGNKIIETFVTVGSNHPQNKLYLHDLAGIFVLTDENVFPAMSYTEPTFDTVYIKQHYHPATYDNIFWNKDGKMKWNYLDAEYTYAIRDAWLVAVKKHPGAYLYHRFQSFLYFLKISNRPVKYYFAFAWIHKNPYGFTLQKNWLWYFFIYPILAQGIMFYMKPWFWLLLSGALLSQTSKLKHPHLRTPFVVLLISALFYILPQFFISQTDTEFRYVYWSCISCSLALLIYIFRNRIQPPLP